MYDRNPSMRTRARKPTAIARIVPALWRAFFATLRAAMRRRGGDGAIRSPHHVVDVEDGGRVRLGPRRVVAEHRDAARPHRVLDRHGRDEVDLLAARDPHPVAVPE